MVTTYIRQRVDWPNWPIASAKLSVTPAMVLHAQGRLIGRMEPHGFELREEAWLQMLTQDLLKTSEIEGERLDSDHVRSSSARRLGMDIGALTPIDRHVEGIVEVRLDAAQNCAKPLAVKPLFDWQGARFPAGRSGLAKIRVARWRDDSAGPMQVISGPIGRKTVHFIAPPAEHLGVEIKAFLPWFENVDVKLDGEWGGLAAY